jgi:hypothetical protein
MLPLILYLGASEILLTIGEQGAMLHTREANGFGRVGIRALFLLWKVFLGGGMNFVRPLAEVVTPPAI